MREALKLELKQQSDLESEGVESVGLRKAIERDMTID